MAGIILFPTDTIYGLGVDATDPEAVSRLRELKGREDTKPISIIVSDMDMMEEYAVVTPLAKKLAEAFLPGKLTLILELRKIPYGNFLSPKPNALAPEISAGTGTVGIRIPKHILCMKLVQELGKPLTATSANVAGKETEKTPEKILQQFGEKASMITKIYDLGELPESAPSTVVDARDDKPIILRDGAIPKEKIEMLFN